MVDRIQKAGAVDIKSIKLISIQGIIVDLKDFLVELNIYEDLFSPCMKGEILLSDSRNLFELANLVGEELINVEFVTPSFDYPIRKTFRVYKISDRTIVKDNNTQMFTMHFASIELFHDINLPLYRSFEGEIDQVASNIFADYLATSRDYAISETDKAITEQEHITPFIVLNATANKVKFVSPGWTPFKCINWLASKAIPKEGAAKNFLFFESNKSYYFGSLEYIFKETLQNKKTIGKYFKSASNIKDGDLDSASYLNREYFIARDVSIVDTTDHVKNYTNGYLANRLYHLDIFNKTYEVVDYDYVQEYKKQWHTGGFGEYAVPIFTEDSLRNFATHISYYPKNPKLFDGFTDNVNERMNEIFGNRRSSMLDLTNLKLNITVPGRTDVEVGKMLYFSYPKLGGKDETDVDNQKLEDPWYSGYYIITAIRHKLNFNDHSMTMECVKDSLYTET